jgi:hypothetical protein
VVTEETRIMTAKWFLIGIVVGSVLTNVSALIALPALCGR